MHHLELWIPAAFPALAIAHFMALLSPGPDFFLIAANASTLSRLGVSTA